MNTIHWSLTGELGRSLLRKFLVLWMAMMATSVFAQAPAAGGGAAPAMSAAQLDKLVGPIALYPDDLIGIILPGSTYPLEIVQADRFLDKRKSDKNFPVNDAWQDSIKSLLNYPDVVKKMSTEIDWTADLGEAVVADQGAVLESIQRFRRQVQAAGNLKSDDKQTIVVEKEVIQVVQANPEVIYVPQYNPSTIVVSGGYSSYGYWPAPYPVYYYPYPPGAAFASGLIWGAAITAAWNGGHYATHYGYGGGNNNININRNTNINTGNINRANINSAQGTAWKSDKKPGQVSGATGRPSSSPRVGDSQAGRGGNDFSRGGNDFSGGGARANNQPASRPSAGMNDRPSASDRSTQSRGGNAFDDYGSGRDARADSSRGSSSRDSMSSSGRGQSQSSFQGGGDRSSSASRASSGGGSRDFSGGGGGGGRASGGGRSGGGGGSRGGRR